VFVVNKIVSLTVSVVCLIVQYDTADVRRLQRQSLVVLRKAAGRTIAGPRVDLDVEPTRVNQQRQSVGTDSLSGTSVRA